MKKILILFLILPLSVFSQKKTKISSSSSIYFENSSYYITFQNAKYFHIIDLGVIEISKDSVESVIKTLSASNKGKIGSGYISKSENVYIITNSTGKYFYINEKQKHKLINYLYGK